MLSADHREALRAARAASARALAQHREILDSERRRRVEWTRARQTRTTDARAHRRALEEAQAIAWEYRRSWREARRDGRRLLHILTQYLGTRAA
jgi:hypothetical protein